MRKNTLITILILFTSILIKGQGSEKDLANDWGISAGYQNFRIIDKNASPLIYVSNNGMLGLHYQKNKAKKIWGIELNASVGNMQSKRFGSREAIVYDPYGISGNRDSVVYEINPSLSFIQVSLNYSYFFKLNRPKRKMFVGAIIQDNFYYGALAADVWYFNQLSIMPSYRVDLLESEKSNIQAEFSVPVFSYLVRQPYTLDPSLPESSYLKANLQTGSNFGSLGQFQQINLKLKYQYTLNSGNQLGLNYYFMWMNYSNIEDRNLRAYANSILLSYTF